MKSFEESFYTEDYDQEMLDFIEENYTIDYVNGWEIKSALVHKVHKNKEFFVSRYTQHYGAKFLTKEQFKEKIGMTNNSYGKNTFTTDMLVAGKHVVELCDGSLMLVLLINEELVFVEDESYLEVDGNFNEKLICADGDHLDVKRIYSISELGGFWNMINKKHLTIEWERPPEKTSAQKHLEEKIAVTRKNLLELEKLLEGKS